MGKAEMWIVRDEGKEGKGQQVKEGQRRSDGRRRRRRRGQSPEREASATSLITTDAGTHIGCWEVG